MLSELKLHLKYFKNNIVRPLRKTRGRSINARGPATSSPAQHCSMDPHICSIEADLLEFISALGDGMKVESDEFENTARPFMLTVCNSVF